MPSAVALMPKKKDLEMSKIKISILTPSIRLGLLHINNQCLKKQVFKGFEWLIGSSFNPKMGTWVKDNFRGGYWSLNRIYNKMLKRAKGELIVSYQDGIWIPNDALEHFYDWYTTKGPKWCVTGVGDLYSALDERNKPIISVWADPRKSGREKNGDAYECYPVDWEANFAAAPRKMFYDIGGFDEELDKFAGMDNVSIVERADELGYRFWIDQSLECFGLKHNRRKNWNQQHAMNGPYEQRKKELKMGGIWPTLNYL